MDTAPTPAEGIQRSTLGRIVDSVPPITDADTGRVRMAYRTFFAIMGIVAVGAVAFFTVQFTADGAAASIVKHEENKFPHVAQFNAVNDKLGKVEAASNNAQASSERAEKQVGVLNGRIEWLIRIEMEQARSTPTGVRRARRAASRVREQAGVSRGAENDPLKGLDGL